MRGLLLACSALVAVVYAAEGDEEERLLKAIQVDLGYPESVTLYQYPFDLVSINVGNPPQPLSVQVSTASSEIWLPDLSACQSAGQEECVTPNAFDASASGSWRRAGDTDLFLGIRSEIGINDGIGSKGMYGFDTVGFGDGSSVEEQIIALVNESQWLENPITSSAPVGVGIVGLNTQDWDFQGMRKGSLLTSLFTSKEIGSKSWGYTPGCLKKENSPVSLTLGGYNAARFPKEGDDDWHDISFELDALANPTVSLLDIKVDDVDGKAAFTDGRPTTLSRSPILVTIDSSTPYLWLPTEVCNNTAEAFKLFHRDSPDMFLFTETLPVDYNLIFRFSDNADETEKTVSIKVPLSMFTFSDPTYSKTNMSDTEEEFYFPIKCTDSAEAFTLGRSFLQNVYLRTNYDHGNFTMHQVVHTSDVKVLPVAAPSFDPPPAEKNRTPMYIGIGVGVGVALLLIAALIIFLMKRRRRRARQQEQSAYAEASGKAPLPLSAHPSNGKPHEQKAYIPSHPQEMEGEYAPKQELPAETLAVEIDGRDREEVRKEKEDALQRVYDSREDGPRVKFLGARWRRG